LAVSLQADQVLLGSGARLACDVPVIAFGAHTPAWLRGSGLTLDEQGWVAVDAMQRSVSHPHVLGAPVADSRGNEALVQNLLATLTGSPLRCARPSASKLKFLSFGDGQALISWGSVSAQGRWVGWLKDRLDQRCLRP
jgi:hypothetical protein